MRELDVSEIVGPVADACIRANRELPPEVEAALHAARGRETSSLGRTVLDTLISNAEIARRSELPTCQDTGMVIAFVEIGQDLHLIGGDLYDAVNQGVRQGYTSGLLRKSVLTDPLTRNTNSGDNTPAVIHTLVVGGDRLRIHLAPKGGGAENMSALWMLKPSDSHSVIVEAIVERVREAGGKPCPPLLLGIGIGGTFDKCALMAKQALLRPLGQPSEDPHAAALERRILHAVNATGVGPMGLGGDTTALAVHILTHPCHITSLPVALNVQCHAARHISIEI
jgi:fumarate hydratase subunit alpha